MRRTLCLVTLLLSITSVAAPGIAGADPSNPGANDVEGQNQQAQRDGIQKRRSEVNGQLDLLKASDVDLELELNRLGNLVQAQQAKAVSARAMLADVEARLGGLTDDVDQAKRDAEAARRRAADRAVSAYMHPGYETAAPVLQAKDYDQAHRRRTLLGEVAHFDSEVLAGHKAAQELLADREEKLTAAKEQARSLHDQEEQALAELSAARDRQASARQALDARINDFQHEADSLAGQEAALTSLINAKASKSTDPIDGGPAPSKAPATTAAPVTTSAPPTTAPPAPGQPAPAPTTTKASPPPPPPGPPPTTAPQRPGGRVSLSWPVGGPVTSPFGMRWGRLHAGIDIGVPEGTPIHAAAAGTVFFCGQMDGYGNVALVDHGGGMVTLYAHQSRLACSVGQRVGQGAVIGYVGSTGHSTGPHLHFEVRINSTPVDPMQYLS